MLVSLLAGLSLTQLAVSEWAAYGFDYCGDKRRRSMLSFGTRGVYRSLVKCVGGFFFSITPLANRELSSLFQRREPTKEKPLVEDKKAPARVVRRASLRHLGGYLLKLRTLFLVIVGGVKIRKNKRSRNK